MTTLLQESAPTQFSGEFNAGFVPDSLEKFQEDIARAFPAAPEDNHSPESYSDAMRFVNKALVGIVDGVSPVQAWDAAGSLLHGLRTYEFKPGEEMGWLNPQSDADSISSWLVEALGEHQPDQENLTSYLNALVAAKQGPWVTYDSYFEDTTKYSAARLLGKHRATLKRFITTEAQAATYAEMFTADDYAYDLSWLIASLDLEHIDNYASPDEYLQKYGAKLDDVLGYVGITNTTSWKTACRHKSTYADGSSKDETAIKQNLARILEIEQRHPGGVELLNDFYGVRGFHRYPLRVLLRQIERHGKTDRPYGVLVGPLEDHNGAFYEMYAQGYHPTKDSRAGDLFDGLGDAYDLRIMEAATTSELAYRFMALDDLYGNAHKISFAAIDMHSSGDDLRLSDIFNSRGPIGKRLGRLTLGHQLKRTRRWFVDNPTFVFFACTSGKANGIAQKVSAEVGGTAVAPEGKPSLRTAYRVIVADSGELKIIPYHVIASDDSAQKTVFSSYGSRDGGSITAALYMQGQTIPPQDPRYQAYFATAQAA